MEAARPSLPPADDACYEGTMMSDRGFPEVLPEDFLLLDGTSSLPLPKVSVAHTINPGIGIDNIHLMPDPILPKHCSLGHEQDCWEYWNGLGQKRQNCLTEAVPGQGSPCNFVRFDSSGSGESATSLCPVQYDIQMPDGMNTYLVSAAYEQSGHGLDGPVSLWPLIDDLSGGWAACEGKLEEATTIMSHNSNSESDTTVYEPGDPDTSFSFLEADKQPYPQEHQPAPDIYHYNGIDDTVHQFSVGPDGRPLPPEFQPPELTVLYQGITQKQEVSIARAKTLQVGTFIAEPHELDPAAAAVPQPAKKAGARQRKPREPKAPGIAKPTKSKGGKTGRGVGRPKVEPHINVLTNLKEIVANTKKAKGEGIKIANVVVLLPTSTNK